jgi:toxin CcdB
MAQFDVYQMADGYVVDCQSDFLSHYDTRLVVPLLPLAHGPIVAKRFNPEFEVEGLKLVMYTQYAAAVQLRRLGKPVKSLANSRDEIVAAIDMLVTGF